MFSKGGIMRVTCTREHKVDMDDDGAWRWARVGDTATVQAGPNQDDWSVMWDNSAWGFYTDEELACDTAPVQEESNA